MRGKQIVYKINFEVKITVSRNNFIGKQTTHHIVIDVMEIAAGSILGVRNSSTNPSGGKETFSHIHVGGKRTMYNISIEVKKAVARFWYAKVDSGTIVWSDDSSISEIMSVYYFRHEIRGHWRRTRLKRRCA